MNVDPARGIGRALLTAVDQLAATSGHRELTSARLILLGFSGTGSLSARLAGYAADRVRAVLATGPGHYEPLGLETIALSAQARMIPQLIIVGSADAVSGTERPYNYFRRHFDHGAPWTFVVQNQVPHCCVINAKALVLEWLDAVVIRGVTRAHGSYGFIKTEASRIEECATPYPPAVPIWCRGTKDSWGGPNWFVRAARTASRPTPPPDMRPAGWLPTRAFAKRWQAFVTQPEHPVTSLP